MLSKVRTAGLNGIEAYPVTVETDVSLGLPAFLTVGLPSVTVREAKERVRAAIMNSWYDFPEGRITVNLAPAGNRKEGSYFDLPIAIGVLATVENNRIQGETLADYGIMGELALDGRVVHVDGALPLVIGLRSSGIKKIMLPRSNLPEVITVEGVEFYPIECLTQAVGHFSGMEKVSPAQTTGLNLYRETDYSVDFSEVLGQEVVKRALTVSVAGGHAIYLHGFPGSGKSMLAKRIPTIMPELSYEEMLEITMIYSVAGKLGPGEPMITRRPFRAPHHSITRAALMGGERPPKPGEVSLAHRGVLFLDEFPEFSRETLETLRQPVEEGKIRIQRGDINVQFPCEFILVAAGNPCKCGYYGSKYRECKCATSSVLRYQSKLSGPLIDRIDMHIAVAELQTGELIEGSMEEEKGADSASMREEVRKCREIQKKRYGSGLKLNASLEGEEIEKYCQMTEGAKRMLGFAADKYALSMRGVSKIRKVARTIADIEGKEIIEELHIGEALSYRVLDHMYTR